MTDEKRMGRLDRIEQAAKDVNDTDPDNWVLLAFNKQCLSGLCDDKTILSLTALVRKLDEALQTLRDTVTDGDRSIPDGYASAIERADEALTLMKEFEND